MSSIGNRNDPVELRDVSPPESDSGGG